jgi:MFS family permease
MLASITPLGERSRGFSWRVTVGAFAIGAVGAGAAGGALVAALGSALPWGARSRALLLLATLAGALIFDATPLRARLPSTRRQVNEDWMARYRGWVYGLAFGAQLGVGVGTIVTCAAIYAAVAAAFLSGDPALGAAVGATFGAFRALSLLPARRARDGEGLRALHRRLGVLELPVRRAAPALELALIALVIGWVA